MSCSVRKVALLGLAVAGICCGPVRAESYAYDALGRLISVITDDGKQTIYSYDAAGNRTTVSTTASVVAQPPQANDDSINFTYGPPNTSFDPRANDTDPMGLPLTIVGVSQPRFGSVSFTGASITYTPPAFHVTGTPDVFTYNIQNSAGLTCSAVVTVNLAS